MSAEDEERFKSGNKRWICDKIFDVGDNKAKDHCHVTEKYKDSTQWSCNINLKLTKKVPVICHNLRGCDSHLIMQEIGKFDAKVLCQIDWENTWLLQLIKIGFLLAACYLWTLA